MKLVTITLLLFVHTADLTSNCEGVKDEVVFCAAGSSLKIVPPATDYAWHFGTADGKVDDDLSTDPTSKELRGTLAAKHTGVYLATKTGSPPDKFTIIVDAVQCTKNEECQVGTGSSIHLNSELAAGVTWVLKDETIGDPSGDEAPKFTAEKKELGLFNVQTTQSGKYKAKKSPSEVEFPVTVSDKTPVSMASVKKGVGCDATLECEVTGDAKTIEWTKDGTKLTPKGKTLTVDKQAASARYVCKVQGYHGGAAVTSAPFPYTYAAPEAVSKVTIERTASVLTCTANGPVKTWEWLTFGNVPVTASDGTVDRDPSKFNLASGAKGQFSCKVTDCQDNTKSSQFLRVGGNVDPTGTPTGTGGATTPGAATQGTSCSVALLVISVLIELYVVMMM